MGRGLRYLEPPKLDARNLGKAQSFSVLSETKETSQPSDGLLSWTENLEREGSLEDHSMGWVSSLPLAPQLEAFPLDSGSPENHLGGVIQSSIWLKLPEHQLDQSDSEN